jgi:hypothetical protein
MWSLSMREHERHFVQYIDDFDGSVDPAQVYEAKVGSKRDACSDLYIDGVLKHEDVPNELLQEHIHEDTPYILELGREITVYKDSERRLPMIRLGVGTQLVKLAAREAFPNFLCQGDPQMPTFWMGKNRNDKHYRAWLTERTIVIVQK